MSTSKPLYVIALFGLSLAQACGQRPPMSAGQAQIIWYPSAVDGSQQAYAAYVPAASAPKTGYPAVFHTHGYGWSVSARFSDWQKSWAEAHRWVLINLNARGPQFYEGIGEVATLEVVRDALARFGLDPERLYITGSSMGGTGAFRHGVRYPGTFAAAVGVDGWTDYRLWHHHWYARADAREAIEEFRRPLLQAASPLYWAERGQWGAIKAVVDGRDTSVWPDNGLQLFAALTTMAYQHGGYDSALTLNYDKGHGGGYDIQDTYNFFLGRSRVTEPHSFQCRTYLLKHGEMYWGAIERFRTFGLPATLASSVSANIATVSTDNLDRFSLHLQASPCAGLGDVSVYADGLLCYSGPPATVAFEAVRDCSGTILAWVPAEGERTLEPVKSAQLAGPIGDVLTQPFVVAYGTAGSEEMRQQHRREAQDFSEGWRAFMIRRGAEPDAIGPYAEEALPPAVLRERSLVIFGTRESSRLLQRAYQAADIPVIVGDDYVTVADASGGPRSYYGDNFGCFVCYPNPLADGRRYLLIARGQWFTKPNGTVLAGLEYDMEKLPWAYPDYMVFNTDQAQLPHVLNVNNKPPVTCYEAGYFVEAGFFDDRWRPDRGVTLDRAWLDKPEGLRFIHVERMKATPDGAEVLVTDAAGRPFAEARVTLTWPEAEYSASALSDQQGWARVAGPSAIEARVMSVMGTGAVYDFTADVASSTADGPLRMVLSRPQQHLDTFGNPYYTLTANLLNLGAGRTRGLLQPSGSPGRWVPQAVAFVLAAGESKSLGLQWFPVARGHDTPLPAGAYLLTVTARPDHSVLGPDDSQAAVASAKVQLGAINCGPLVLEGPEPPQFVAGQPYRISCELLNTASEQMTVELSCSIIPAGTALAAPECYRYLAPPAMVLSGLDKAAVVWQQQPDEEPLPVGLYQAVVYASDRPELTTRIGFSVTANPSG